MPHLELSLFGSPRVQLNGVVVDIPAQKALALLAYLALTGVPHRRDSLATLFWPDYEQTSARTYLRQALHELTKTLGHPWFDVSREEVGLAREASIQTDVHEFQRLVHAGVEDAGALRQAIALYKADFLAGFSLPDCPEFEQWQLLERESLRHTLAEALQALMRWQASRHEYAAAIELGRRRLALDPYHEPAQRFLMQLYAWAGQQSAALRQYEECKRLLGEGLQTLPDPETEALYHAIRNKRLSAPPPLSQRADPQTAQASPLSNVVSNVPPSVPASRLAAVAVPSFLSAKAVSPRVAPFVARERELNELAVALASAQQSNGQILFVIGGAGRGKSTLVQEFARRAQEEHADLLVASGTCNAYTGSGDPYLPFREILIALSGDVEAKWAGGLISTENARRLWEAMPTNLPALVAWGPDLLRTFVPIKSLQGRAERFAPPDADWLQELASLATEDQRLPLEERQLFTQFTDALTAIAAHYPLLLILDDLHWVDAASNNLLFHLSRVLAQSRILVVGTYRPDELAVSRNRDRHPLAGIVGELKRQHGDIWLDLGDLSPEEGQAFVDAYLDVQPNRLDEEFRTALFRHTGGHALFTVELLREMQERGDVRRDGEGNWVAGETINWTVLPAKIEGVIEQRIGRLEQGLQEMLAVASIEGESFTAEVVARARGVAEYELVQQLGQELDRQHRLVMAEAPARVGSQRLSRYRFRHHLFQRYLYNRLTASERAYLHEKVGTAMETLYAEQSASVAVQLAHHFEQAGLAEKAVAYLRQAGEQAHHISANREAIQLLTRASTLLSTLAPTRRHAEEELALLITLGRALQHIKGIGSQDARQVYLRAYELCDQVGNDHDRFAAMHGLRSTSGYSKSLATEEEMLHIAASQPSPIYLVSAHHVMGHNLMTFGYYTSARAHLEQSIAFYDTRHHVEYLLLCGQDEGIAALANLSLTLWYLGYPDQALQRAREAVDLAKKLSHPMSIAIATHFEVWVHLLRGEAQIAQPKIDALLELGGEQGFGFVMAVAHTYRAQALRLEGQIDAAIEHFERARETWRAMQFAWYEPYLLLELVVAHCRIGHFEHGLRYLREAEAAIEATPEFNLQDVMYRIKGEVLLAQALKTGGAAGNEAALQLERAEAAFMQSIQLARACQAKIRELQATIGLCRLWQQQGKIAAAGSTLGAIYGWFTEGFDTAVLVEAKALLAALTTAPSNAGPHVTG